MHILDILSGLIPAALQLALAIIMLRRRDYRPYPFFFAYTAYSFVVTIIRVGLMQPTVSYFVLSKTNEAIQALLALLCMGEIFKPERELLYESHPRMRNLILPATLLALIGIGLWRGSYLSFGPSVLGHVTPGIYGFVIGVCCLESGLYFLAVALRRLRWLVMEERPFLILMGFGLAAFFSLLGYLARYQFGEAWETVFRYMPIGAYIATTCLWLAAFLKPEPPRLTPKPELAKVQSLLDLQKSDKDTLDKLKKGRGLRWSTLPH
jgi:hypothetical protein